MKVFLISLIVLFGMPAAFADLGEEVSGGGQILDGSYKVSFGVYALDGDPAGELQVNFHNVSADWLDKGKFHGEEVFDMNFYGAQDTCNAAVNMVIYGSLDGVSGYSVVFRVGDFDAPGHWIGPPANAFDTVRIQLFDYEVTGPATSGHIYDTHAGDFTDESSCHGSARTKLDRGNLTIEMD